MSAFGLKTRQGTEFARGVYTVRKGIDFLEQRKFDAALREFQKVSASRRANMPNLVRGVANFYAYNTERLRKETRKASFGNARLLRLPPGNRKDAWSDVDIAAVLVAPPNHFTTLFLTRFLGRTEEAVRFQRRYAFEQPLTSWIAENGKKYTRFTQNRRVAHRLGVAR